MKRTKNNKRNISFQIKGIELLDFTLKQTHVQLPSKTVFNYHISIQHRINSEKKLVTVIVEIRILHEDKKTILGTMKVGNIFSLENFDDIAIKNENNTILFPDKVVEALNNIAISTTRGVMFACFRGTLLHQAVLPVIDPKGLKK